MLRIPKIHDRGRGPEIEGTRITVYDVMDYYIEGWPATRIAARFELDTPDIQAAIDYIEAHRAEVDADYREIVERSLRGNPPELQAKIDARRPIVQAKMAEMVGQARIRKQNGANGGANGDAP